jgi:RNA polymerase sigma-70 factor (ECF subfamily)
VRPAIWLGEFPVVDSREKITMEWSDEWKAASVAELVLAAQAGQRGAMGELLERYRPMVAAVVARRLRDATDAQELVQEVCLQVIQKLHQLRTPECFGGWLRAIADRMAINRVSRRPAAGATEPRTMEAACIEHRTPLAVAVEHERAEQVRSAVAGLRRLDRDTLEAFYIRGQSLSEMSVEFDAPIGTIKRRLHVARLRLAEQVGHLVSV